MTRSGGWSFVAGGRIWSHDFWSIWDFVAPDSPICSETSCNDFENLTISVMCLQESHASLELVAVMGGFRNCDAIRSTLRRVLRVAPGEYGGASKRGITQWRKAHRPQVSP